ncbi:CAZyme family AA1 [Penicillium bovifimosum]|uniref:CAZyme family AA1 n=1 Tax=Penicillium bovifimosum TaxID=126998 RepID=A0A9W9L0M8_9EURO|nr:CAZyme family AA1 [Penicillium bovifimosum]KAJ5131343.1 CAZyme family AA1 [Penicillium bovifimosum]
MQKQSSGGRKSIPTQKEPIPPSRPEFLYLPWSVVRCSLAACLLIGLVYLLQFTPAFSLTPMILLGGNYQQPQTEAINARPQIELHPEDHVYREPTTQYLNWRVTSDDRRPDGVLKRVYLINGLFPGPTVEARSGDTLIITVTNALPEESIALHWHGLHVANVMDGAAGVSQCPIASGSQFVYNLTIPSDQSGTSWYHDHSGVARVDGLYGGLVIHAPASRSTVRGLISRARDEIHHYTYDKEILLLIGDWYHRPAVDVLEWYMDPGNFGNEPVPDSLLINGAGYFDCMMAVPARPVDCINQLVDYSIFNLDPRTTYRIRVVNTGALAGFSLLFDRHYLDLLQVDSVDVERSKATDINSVGVLFPGQRMDFIVRPVSGTTAESSSITIQLDKDCFKYPNPALTPDQTFPIDHRPSNITHHHLDLEEVPSAQSIIDAIPPKAEQTHVVYTKIQKLAQFSNKPFGYFNQTSWKPQQRPSAHLASLPRNEWDANQLAITTGHGPTWVDLVVNNLDEGSHPFHLHGHHFYVLAVHQAEFGWGSYDPFTEEIPAHLGPDSEPEKDGTETVHSPKTAFISGLYGKSRVALRDTVNIPSRGYAVLRFRADNPGVWLFHCHIPWHFATGMAMIVDVQGDPAGLAAHVSSEGLCSL